MQNPKRKKEYAKIYYQKNKDKFREKRYKNGVHIEILRRFGRDPKIVFSRDGWKCKECNSTEDLTIHHIDGNGRKSKTPNNKINNLKTLCRSCHGKMDGKKGGVDWNKLPIESKRKMLSNLKNYNKFKDRSIN